MKLLLTLFIGIVSLFACGCGGTRHMSIDNLIGNGYFRLLAVDSNDIIYTAGHSNHPGGDILYRSSDNGENWEEIEMPGISPVNRTLDFIVAGNNDTLITGSGYANFILHYPRKSIIQTDLKFSSMKKGKGDRIFARSQDKLFLSTDNGITWDEIFSDSFFIYSFAENSKGDIIIGTEKGRIFILSQSGIKEIVLSIKGNFVRAIEAGPSDQIFAVVNNEGVFRSTDDAMSWLAVNEGLDYDDLTTIMINPGGDIFAATNGDGIYRSTNMGNNWTEVNEGLEDDHVWALAVNSAGDIFAATSYGGVLRSKDNGNSWSAKNFIKLDPETLAMVQKYKEHEDSSALSIALSITAKRGELVPAIAFQHTSDPLKFSMQPLSTVIIYKDPNFENKVNASYSGLIAFGTLYAGALIHSDDIKGETGKNLKMLLALPAILAASEAQLFIPGMYPFIPSVFVNWRTDIFTNWWRFNGGFGVQLSFSLDNKKNYKSRALSFIIGGEKTMFGKKIYDNMPGWVGGIKYTF